jgi:RHS repeat-associated protein
MNTQGLFCGLTPMTSSGTVRFAYDALNHLTNMVDAVGTTRYTYDAAGQLLTEGGIFTSDTMANTYTSRQRVGLSLQQPTGAWTNGFGWDLAGRLTNVASKAGTFGYGYTALDGSFSGRLVQRLSLPSGAYATNNFDPVARVLDTVLKSSGGSNLDSALYGYTQGNQRTGYTNAAGTYVNYTYDSIGQLKAAAGSTPSENRGYGYDAAWNLSCRTNNGAACNFWCDCRNQLTNTAGFALAYDANGNLTNQVTDAYGDYMAYAYDDENRLIDVQNLSVAYETVFIYDGLGRLRIRQEYRGPPTMSPLVPTAGLPLVSVVNYIYDGWRVIQERDSNNVPQVSYTRGLDLSGSLEGAGGIGGLLARSSGYSSGNWTSHAYYHSDGNGNITCLVDTNQSVVASYRYDPFGNPLSKSGTLADANVYRFSSKEIHTNSLMYYYGYRFADPNLQRWLNRDPIADVAFYEQLAAHRSWNERRSLIRESFDNAYVFAHNGPPYYSDPNGLMPYWGCVGKLLTCEALSAACVGSVGVGVISCIGLAKNGDLSGFFRCLGSIGASCVSCAKAGQCWVQAYDAGCIPDVDIPDPGVNPLPWLP